MKSSSSTSTTTRISRIPATVAILFLAWTSLGADDCALTQIGQPSPNGSDTPLPPCLTDPPAGCAAVCNLGQFPDEPTWVSFTAACADVSAGPQTATFEASVGEGGFMCDPNDGFGDPVVWPASVGIATVQVEKSDACASP